MNDYPRLVHSRGHVLPDLEPADPAPPPPERQRPGFAIAIALLIALGMSAAAAFGALVLTGYVVFRLGRTILGI